MRLSKRDRVLFVLAPEMHPHGKANEVNAEIQNKSQRHLRIMMTLI